jgi:hypothetical protein
MESGTRQRGGRRLWRDVLALREWQAMQIGIGLPKPELPVWSMHPCTDGVHNQHETDIDCGGPYSACPTGKSCASNADCQSNLCLFGHCQ